MPNPQAASPRRRNVLGVHSLHRFVISVPDVAPAEKFYRAFGLDVRRDGDRLDLYTHGHPALLGQCVRRRRPKRLQYLSFGAYAEDFDALARQVRAARRRGPASALGRKGVWTRDADGTPVQLVVGPKVTPNAKERPQAAPTPQPGKGAAPGRSAAPPVRPRRLSHVLLFSPDVPRQVAFYERTLGLRLSDRSADIIAFLHGPHASDHHLVAFAKSSGPGYHHSSWDVGLDRRRRPRRRADAHRRLHARLGRGAPRPRLQLFLLRAGSRGEAGPSTRTTSISFPSTSTGPRPTIRPRTRSTSGDPPSPTISSSIAKRRSPPDGAARRRQRHNPPGGHPMNSIAPSHALARRGRLRARTRSRPARSRKARSRRSGSAARWR